MSSRPLITGEKRAYPNHCEENDDGAKGGLYWGDARDLLDEIEAIDGQVQCGEYPVPTLRLLQFVGHGQSTR